MYILLEDITLHIIIERRGLNYVTNVSAERNILTMINHKAHICTYPFVSAKLRISFLSEE